MSDNTVRAGTARAARRWDGHRVVRTVVMLGGWGLVGAGILGVVAHVSGLVSSTLSRLASFTPVFVLGAMVGLVVLLSLIHI